MTMASSETPEVIRLPDQVEELSLAGVSKHYGPIVAVADASIAFRTGEVAGLVGENGAGKSTLISLVTGANRPDTGSFAVGGVVAGDTGQDRPGRAA